jgi:hypothetical protein
LIINVGYKSINIYPLMSPKNTSIVLSDFYSFAFTKIISASKHIAIKYKKENRIAAANEEYLIILRLYRYTSVFQSKSHK